MATIKVTTGVASFAMNWKALSSRLLCTELMCRELGRQETVTTHLEIPTPKARVLCSSCWLTWGFGFPRPGCPLTAWSPSSAWKKLTLVPWTQVPLEAVSAESGRRGVGGMGGGGCPSP